MSFGISRRLDVQDGAPTVTGCSSLAQAFAKFERMAWNGLNRKAPIGLSILVECWLVVIVFEGDSKVYWQFAYGMHGGKKKDCGEGWGV